jgi:hypothetical protein
VLSFVKIQFLLHLNGARCQSNRLSHIAINFFEMFMALKNMLQSELNYFLHSREFLYCASLNSSDNEMERLRRHESFYRPLAL